MDFGWLVSREGNISLNRISYSMHCGKAGYPSFPPPRTLRISYQHYSNVPIWGSVAGENARII